jgi:hypothetical protein
LVVLFGFLFNGLPIARREHLKRLPIRRVMKLLAPFQFSTQFSQRFVGGASLTPIQLIVMLDVTHNFTVSF